MPFGKENIQYLHLQLLNKPIYIHHHTVALYNKLEVVHSSRGQGGSICTNVFSSWIPEDNISPANTNTM